MHRDTQVFGNGRIRPGNVNVLTLGAPNLRNQAAITLFVINRDKGKGVDGTRRERRRNPKRLAS